MALKQKRKNNRNLAVHQNPTVDKSWDNLKPFAEQLPISSHAEFLYKIPP